MEERAIITKVFNKIPSMDPNLVDYVCKYICITCRDIYPNGALKRVYTLRYDKYHGRVTEYYQSNTTEQPRVKRSCVYTDGVLDGPWIELYPDGKTKTVTKYSKGKVSGPLGVFRPNGEFDQDNSMIQLSCVIS
jgi:antitoxin component YwqK of YwqJK toxin-antitoxin module